MKNLGTRLSLLSFLSIFMTGCSWNIYPFIRNLTDKEVILKVISSSEDFAPEDLGKIRYLRATPEMNNQLYDSLKDSLSFEVLAPNQVIVKLPAHSTACIQTPFNWYRNTYLIIIERDNGRIDTLLHDIKAKTLRKDGKVADSPRTYSKDIVYFEIE